MTNYCNGIKGMKMRAGEARENYSVEGLVNSMDLDEMLEALNIVKMGVRGEKIPFSSSAKVQKYAGEVLDLNKKDDTKPMVEKMMRELTIQIVKINKKMADPVESERLYRELMAEE